MRRRRWQMHSGRPKRLVVWSRPIDDIRPAVEIHGRFLVSCRPGKDSFRRCSFWKCACRTMSARCFRCCPTASLHQLFHVNALNVSVPSYPSRLSGFRQRDRLRWMMIKNALVILIDGAWRLRKQIHCWRDLMVTAMTATYDIAALSIQNWPSLFLGSSSAFRHPRRSGLVPCCPDNLSAIRIWKFWRLLATYILRLNDTLAHSRSLRMDSSRRYSHSQHERHPSKIGNVATYKRTASDVSSKTDSPMQIWVTKRSFANCHLPGSPVRR